MNTLTYRQGDVALVKAPKTDRRKLGKVKAKGRITLALGEVTGHSHTLIGEVAEFEVDGKRMVWVETPAVIEHQEHGAIEVAPGLYFVQAQREYVPQALPRLVLD